MTTPIDRLRYACVVALVAMMLFGHVHWMPPVYSAWLFALLGFAIWRTRREGKDTAAAA